MGFRQLVCLVPSLSDHPYHLCAQAEVPYFRTRTHGSNSVPRVLVAILTTSTKWQSARNANYKKSDISELLCHILMCVILPWHTLMETFRKQKFSIIKYILRNIYYEILKHIQVKECSCIASKRKANKNYDDSNFVGKYRLYEIQR